MPEPDAGHLISHTYVCRLCQNTKVISCKLINSTNNEFVRAHELFRSRLTYTLSVSKVSFDTFKYLASGQATGVPLMSIGSSCTISNDVRVGYAWTSKRLQAIGFAK